MNEQQLFNKPINPHAADNYIKKRGLKVSKAVKANSLAAKNCQLMSNRYENSMYKVNEKLIKEAWKHYLNQAQIANAFSWMMIKTAIDEYQQGWEFIENGDKYISEIIDQGVSFTKKQKKNISLIRYYGQLYSKALNKKYFPSFKKDNLQYWYMKLDDLNGK